MVYVPASTKYMMDPKSTMIMKEKKRKTASTGQADDNVSMTNCVIAYI